MPIHTSAAMTLVNVNTNIIIASSSSIHTYTAMTFVNGNSEIVEILLIIFFFCSTCRRFSGQKSRTSGNI